MDHRWPGRPPLQSDESLASWLARTAAANGLRPGELYRIVQPGEDRNPRDLDRYADDHLLDRLAYQVPDGVGGPCGRSFEDAFMLANPNLFGLEGTPPGELEEKAFDRAKGVKKSAFALQFAIDEKNWTTPLYIAEGLRWLACEPLAGDLLGGGAAHV